MAGGGTEKRFDITLAGETNLDLVLYGLPEQMPVERELLASGFQLTLGGSSSILAHNLARLGSRVGFATRVGRDEMGALAVERLKQAGLDLSQLTYSPERATGVTLLLPHGANRHILTYPGAMAEMTTNDLDLEQLSSSRHFHLSSLFLQAGMHLGLPELFASLKKLGLTLSLDTNDDPEDQWAGVLDQLLDQIDVLLPNEDELKRMTRAPTLERALDAFAGRVPLIVVKCGAHGAVVQQGRARTWIDPVSVQPVDTIGAGDSFDAGFLHAFVRGQTAVQAAHLGAAAGALSTLRPGGTEAFRDAALRNKFLAGFPRSTDS